MYLISYQAFGANALPPDIFQLPRLFAGVFFYLTLKVF